MLRVQHQADSAGSFFEFVNDLMRVPHLNFDWTGDEMEKALKSIGVTFKGKAIDIKTTYAILAVSKFARNPVSKAALIYLEQVAPGVFQDKTIIATLCQGFKKFLAKDGTPEEVGQVRLRVWSDVGGIQRSHPRSMHRPRGWANQPRIPRLIKRQGPVGER